MTTSTIVINVAGVAGPVNGVSVTAWNISRFGYTNVPSQGTAKPSGTADATATSADIGANGQAVLTVPTGSIYNICATYDGTNYWTQSSEALVNTGPQGAQGSTGAQGTHCLLYTSPSPRDRTRSRMPSSA